MRVPMHRPVGARWPRWPPLHARPEAIRVVGRCHAHVTAEGSRRLPLPPHVHGLSLQLKHLYAPDPCSMLSSQELAARSRSCDELLAQLHDSERGRVGLLGEVSELQASGGECRHVCMTRARGHTLGT
jgi:hypothetical protein